MEKNKDYLLSLLKDKYDYENARKSELDAGLNIPITILSALFAGLYFIVSDQELKKAPCCIKTFMYSFAIILFISSSITMFMLFKVYFGYKRRYNTFPASKTVYEVDYKYLEKHNLENNSDMYDDALTTHLKEFTIKWYLDCNNNNTPVNDERSDALFYARMGVGVSIALGLILLVIVSIIKVS